MGSIFDKYKPTSTDKVKKLKEQEDKLTNTKRADRIDLTDGVDNKLRIGPKHPGENHWMVMRCCHWIKIDKDGESATRTVPNARIHGGLSADPIELYIELVKTELAGGDEDAAEKLKKITAWKGGMLMSTTWEVYAKKIAGKERGPWSIFEFWRPVRDAINNRMFVEDEDDAIEADPYTDPIKGRCILVKPTTKGSGKSAKKETIVNIADKPSPLTEEEMEAYDKLTPLSKLPDMQYSVVEFELAVTGIKYWDENEDINLFDNEDFQEALKALKTELKKKKGGAATDTEETDDELPFEEEESDKKKKSGAAKPANKKASKQPEVEEDEENQEDEEATDEAEEEAEEVETDKFDEMERRELIAYKAKKQWENVKIWKTDSDDDIRAKLREQEAADEENGAGEEDAEEAEEPEEKPVKSGKAATTAAKKSELSLDDIKKRLNKSAGKK